MKKIVLSIVTLLVSLVLMPIVQAEGKVPVYMFSKEGCSACAAAQEYFDELAKEYPDLFELYEIEVFDGNWNALSSDLQELLIKVYDEFGEDSSKASTPTIVIGEYHTLGMPKDKDLVYDAIVAARDAEEKVDKVKEFAEELNVDLTQFVVQDDTGGKYDAIIIIGIFVVLIGGFAALVIAGKK